MRRSGQGGNLAQAVLELSGPVAFADVERGVQRLSVQFPILGARVERTLPVNAPFWRLPRQTRPVPLMFWRESGVSSVGASDRRGEVRDVRQLLLARIGSQLPEEANLCIDVIDRSDGTSTLSLTWKHVLLDAKGAELLLTALARLGEEPPVEVAPAQTAPETVGNASWRGRMERASTIGHRLNELKEPGFRSLGGPIPRRAGPRYEVMTLDGRDARRILERAEQFSGVFAQTAFFLACAIRAHHAIFTKRRETAGSFVASIPMQTLRKGAGGPVFQNHLSILFFGLGCDQVQDLKAMTKVLREQLADMLRSRLDQSWTIGLDLARRVPSPILMRLIRKRFGGEIASFFHSFTGPFAPEVRTLFGADVRNAYHAPAVAQPPGTGIFVGEHGSRINVTLSWREGSLTEHEASCMLASLRDDFLGLDDAGSRVAAEGLPAGLG